MATFIGPIKQPTGFIGPIKRPTVPPRTTPIAQALKVVQAQPQQTIVPARTTPIAQVLKVAQPQQQPSVKVTGANGMTPLPYKPDVNAQDVANFTRTSTADLITRGDTNPLTAPLRTITRFALGGLDPIIKDFSNIHVQNYLADRVAKGELHPDVLNANEVIDKSFAQLVGDSAQAVLTAYTPRLVPELLAEGMGKEVTVQVVKELAKQGIKEGGIAGLQFGVAQALSSGTKDPKEFAKIVAENAAIGAGLGAATSAGIPAIRGAAKYTKGIQEDLAQQGISAEAGFVKNPLTSESSPLQSPQSQEGQPQLQPSHSNQEKVPFELSQPHTSSGGQPSEIQSSVDKLISALKQAEPIRKEQEKIYTAERSKRLEKVLAVRNETQGEAGLYAELGQLKGELPKVQYESLRGKVAQTDIDNLFNAVTQSNRLGEFEKITARQGLAKLFGEAGGSVPTTGELKLLKQVFPEEVVSTLLEKQSLLSKVGQGVINTLNIPRSLMSSFDLSAPFRQGLFLIGKPRQFFSAFSSMFKQFGSEKAYQAVQESIQTRPTYPLMRESKLALTDMGSILSGREERFMSNWAERIPIIGRFIKASDRAYTGFLNKLRADVFDSLIQKADELGVDQTPKMTHDLAKFINTATGRGNLGPLEPAAQALNSVFFSPRLMASRVQTLNPVYYMNLDPFVRKEALKTMLSSGSIVLSVIGLAKMGGAKVETDPRNADFAKIKVGNTRFDVMGGAQQYIRLAAQLVSGKIVSSTTGKTMTLGEGYKPLTRLDILERFFQGKENPIASFVTDYLQGQDLIGNDFKLSTEIVNRFVPMITQDLQDAMKEWGPIKGVAVSSPSVFGVGTQTYKPTEQQVTQMKEESSKERIAPIYQRVQELKNQGKMDEAQAIVNGLSESDYKIYQSIKAAEKRAKATSAKK